MSYGQYVARYDPPKARPKPQEERWHREHYYRRST